MPLNIQFRPIDTTTIADFCILEEWHNDQALKSLSNWNSSEAELLRYLAKEEIQRNYKDGNTRHFLILDGVKPIGEFTWQPDPPQLFKKTPGTAWISIVIADPNYRKRGVGKLAMDHFEQIFIAENFKRVELGVFSFNVSAIHFYTRLGYQEIGRIANFTFFQGKMHDDIRMEKWLLNVPELIDVIPLPPND